jgi:hypothetical protein
MCHYQTLLYYFIMIVKLGYSILYNFWGMYTSKMCYNISALSVSDQYISFYYNYSILSHESSESQL